MITNREGWVALWDDFVAGYIEALLFCGVDDKLDIPREDMTKGALEAVDKDCAVFLTSNLPIIAKDAKQAGRDFFLSRNGHGSGFFDREELWGEINASVLQNIAAVYGETDFYLDEEERVCHG